MQLNSPLARVPFARTLPRCRRLAGIVRCKPAVKKCSSERIQLTVQPLKVDILTRPLNKTNVPRLYSLDISIYSEPHRSPYYYLRLFIKAMASFKFVDRENTRVFEYWIHCEYAFAFNLHCICYQYCDFQHYRALCYVRAIIYSAQRAAIDRRNRANETHWYKSHVDIVIYEFVDRSLFANN